MASLLFEDWDQGQTSDLLGLEPGSQVVHSGDPERSVALGRLYQGVAEQRRLERQGETRPIWSLLNPVGTESVGEQSVTVPRGGFDPARSERFGEHSVWLSPGTAPVTEGKYQAMKEAGEQFQEDVMNVEVPGLKAPTMLASARKLKGPRPPEPSKPTSYDASGGSFKVAPEVLPAGGETLTGKLGSNADEILAAKGLPAYNDIVPSRRTVALTEAELKKGAPKGEVFDLSQTHEVPDVEQRDLSRIDPNAGRRKGLPAHIQDTVNDPELRAKLKFVAEKGVEAGGAYWYNAEPLRLAFVKELGEDQGNEIFKRYMSIVGATSAGSEVGQNVRAASYYQHRERLGEPVQSTADLISPYGHKMQQAHISGYKGLGEHGEGTTLNPETQPKRSSFVENLGGNQDPVTIDKHNLRLIGMLSKNPAFLNTQTVADVNYPKLGIVKGEARNWRDEVAAGRITMDQAIEHPHMWQDVPDPVHYGALEKWQQGIAREMGLTPAQFQAALWVGGGRVTGLRSLPISFMGIVENRLAQTAAKRGITADQALKEWITNKAPLLSVGGGGLGLLGVGQQQEDQRAQ